MNPVARIFAFFVLLLAANANPEYRLLDEAYWKIMTPVRLKLLIEEGALLSAVDEAGMTPLHYAALYADAVTMEALIRRLREGGVLDPDRPRADGLTPLLLAAEHNIHPGVATALVRAGAGLETKNGAGETALHLAARLNPELAVMRELVSLGSPLEARDDDGWTPLLAAADSGRADKLEVLLAAGASLKPAPDGTTALHLAAASAPDEEAIQLLLDAGLEPGLRDAEGWTPLHSAAAFNVGEGAADVARVLLDAGADLESRTGANETPLHLTARLGGRMEVLVLLLDRGADPNARDADGWTPLHGASAEGSPEMVRALLRAGADVNARDDRAATPLLLLAGWCDELDEGARARARALAEAGADLDARDRQGWSVLHRAAAAATEEALRFWAGLGPSVRARSYAGETPLHLAARLNPDPAALRVLAALGSDLEARDGDGWTPFLAAAAGGQAANARVLVKLGADVHARSKLGRNALHLAARFSEDEETVTVLVDLGVDPAQQDAAGAYPWNLLLKNPALASSDLVLGLYPIGLHPEAR